MTKDERSYKKEELKSLADYLQEKQDDILKAWKDKTYHDQGDQVSTLISLSHRKFYNDIPEYLEKLRDGLRDDIVSLDHLPKGHGSHRWRHGIDLREVILEWDYLHQVLMTYIIQFYESNGISACSLIKVMQKLTRFLHAGIKISVEEFYQLQRQQAEGKLQDLEEVILKHNNETEQRGQNLQEASHDLKGSLTAVTTNLFLLGKTNLDDKGQKLYEKLSGSVENLSELLTNLLDLSRLEAGREQLNISEVNVAELMQNFSDNIESMAEKEGLELRSNGDNSLTVQSDRLKLQRIVQNLILNSLKYTEEGYVEINWLTEPESPDHWELNIRDTGPGFDYSNTVISAETGSARTPQEDSKVNNTDPVEKQSEGIGLLIVRQLCNLLGAVLDVRSSPTVGTHFRIVFPREYPQDYETGN